MTTLIRTVLLTGGLMLATNGGAAVAAICRTGSTGAVLPSAGL